MLESLELSAEFQQYFVEATLGNLFVEIVDEVSMALEQAYCYPVIAVLTENEKQRRHRLSHLDTIFNNLTSSKYEHQT